MLVLTPSSLHLAGLQLSMQTHASLVMYIVLENPVFEKSWTPIQYMFASSTILTPMSQTIDFYVWSLLETASKVLLGGFPFGAAQAVSSHGQVRQVEILCGKALRSRIAWSPSVSSNITM